MKRILFVAASIMLLGFTSCEKGSVQNYAEQIVGWWQFENKPTDNKAFQCVFNFRDNGFVDTFDNISSEGYTETLYQVQPTWFYWIEGDLLCDQVTRSDYPDGSCCVFANPECECNQECLDHVNGKCHYTKIVTLTSNKLVLELYYDGDKETWSLRRIDKPSRIQYKQ